MSAADLPPPTPHTPPGAPGAAPAGDPAAAPAQRSAVYGPVHSWRLGNSLGIDLLVHPSICSFHCIYCQLGRIERHTAEQGVFVPTAQVARELDAVDWRGIDVVTFSGSGEPTLALNLGEVVNEIRRRSPKTPIHMLTNAAHFLDPATRQRVLGLDQINAKLDAATEEQLHRVNRPAPGVYLSHILEGLRKLRREYRGRLALQCMVLATPPFELEAILRIVEELRPDEVHLNAPLRPKPHHWVPGARGEAPPPPEDCSTLRPPSRETFEAVEAAFRSRFPDLTLVSAAQKLAREDNTSR